MSSFDKDSDVIDSRDIIERIAELQQALDLSNELDAEGKHAEALSAFDEDDRDELRTLEKLEDEAAPYSPDWKHGATLIRDSYFREYAEQLADDMGAIDRNASWPCCCIDWDRAASELKQDYTLVEFDGVTYWIRN